MKKGTKASTPKVTSKPTGLAQIAKQRRPNAFMGVLLLLRQRGLGPTHGDDCANKELWFHKTRDWRFDFAWPSQRVAVEVEGGTYGFGKKCELCGQRRTGRHSSITGIKGDMEKYNSAAIDGWIVLRFTSDECERNPVKVFESIMAAF